MIGALVVGGVAVSRRTLVTGFAAALAAAPATRAGVAAGRFDVTFLFTNDIHACRMAHGLSPHCKDEGKTDHALRRHVAGINRVHHHRWPKAINGAPTGLHGAGEPIAQPRGLVIGGDMTDDGGGQVAHPGGPCLNPATPICCPAMAGNSSSSASTTGRLRAATA